MPKISELTPDTAPSADDLLVLVNDPSGTPATRKTTIGDLALLLGLLSENAQTGTSYTLGLSDRGKLVSMSNASANTLTVPPNSAVGFPVGTQILVEQYGAGQTTIAPGAGVTIYSSGSRLKLGQRYAWATLVKRATNTWSLVGEIAA